jgi:Recombinase
MRGNAQHLFLPPSPPHWPRGAGVRSTLQASGSTGVRSIAAALNDQGIQAPRGDTWHPTAISRLLTRYRRGRGPIDHTTGWFDPLDLKEHSRLREIIQATAFNLSTASGLAQSSRLRIASSTSASACLASRASASAACARNSTAVSLSSAATIRE